MKGDRPDPVNVGIAAALFILAAVLLVRAWVLM